MRSMISTAMLCVALASLVCSTATATLSVKWIGGDKVVYDETNGTYWYPHLDRMIQKTKNQQLCFVGQELNAKAYGDIVDWHFATLDQMTALCFSMAQGAAPAGIGPDDTESFFPVNPLEFFTATNFSPAMAGGTLAFTGRTTNEIALREDADGSVDYRWAEGQYSIRYIQGTQIIVFDYDLDYVSDSALTAPLPQKYVAPVGTAFECSAWVVSQMGPVTCEVSEYQPTTSEPPACEPPASEPTECDSCHWLPPVWDPPTCDPPQWLPPVWDPPVVDPPEVEPVEWPFGEIDPDFWSVPDVNGTLFDD